MNFILQVPLYPVEIMVCIGQQKNEITKGIKRWRLPTERQKISFIEAIEDDPGQYGGMVHDLEETGLMILVLYDAPTTAEGKGLLAHEVFHLAEKIAAHIGLKHCGESSEAFAYLIGYLTEKIYERARKK